MNPPPETRDQDRCRTRYPILMVHGAGFRDNSLKINYWGRIAEALEETGARIYYGNHDAWGSIADSAGVIAVRIDELLKAEGCAKVNIIAHSKGGLDCRHLISSLGYANRVASLVTISTPHHGSSTLDLLYRLPRWLLSFASLFVNLFFRLLGDKNPSFDRAAMELSRRACRDFNRANRDAPSVYYRSFASIMKSPFNDLLFFFSNIILGLVEGPNDGLVALRSARRGNFSEFSPERRGRGLSHADVVDLRRRDRWGFDIRAFYLDILADLHARGL